MQIAGALAKAHGAGIIHRDLKPGNIMITDGGIVKVLDFGLAKLAESEETVEDEGTRTMRPRTEEGVIVGTASYMSPEQAESKPLDGRSDIFSFGAVLYEIATGVLAPAAVSAVAAWFASRTASRPEAPLTSVPLTTYSGSERTPSFSPDGNQVAFTWNGDKQDNDDIYVKLIGGGPPLRLTIDPVRDTGPAWSPDGRRIVFDSNKEGQYEIYVIDSGGGVPRRLTNHPTDDAAPSFSRDGKQIYFSSKRTGRWEVWKMPLGGGEPVQLTKNGGVSPDGHSFLYTQIDDAGSDLVLVENFR